MQYSPETYRNRVVVCGKYLSVAWKQYSLALQIVQFDKNEYICFGFRKPTPSFVLNTQFENSQVWQTINNRYVYVNITKRLKNLERVNSPPTCNIADEWKRLRWLINIWGDSRLTFTLTYELHQMNYDKWGTVHMPLICDRMVSYMENKLAERLIAGNSVLSKLNSIHPTSILMFWC